MGINYLIDFEWNSHRYSIWLCAFHIDSIKVVNFIDTKTPLFERQVVSGCGKFIDYCQQDTVQRETDIQQDERFAMIPTFQIASGQVALSG